MLIENRKKDFNPTDKRYINVADPWKLSSQYSLQSDWQFRIYAQMLYRSKQCDYNVYFFTLTYQDKYLPTFHYDEFSVKCFNSDIINKFVRGVQMDLLRMFNCTDYDYIICDEYGSVTARPHHHGSFLVPSFVPPLAVHRLIKKHWSILTGQYKKNGCPIREKLGWVLPDKIKGWTDKKGIKHSDFQVDPKNIDSCAIYLSKYCTKQVGWLDNQVVADIRTRMESKQDLDGLRNFRKCRPKIKTSLHFGEIINDWIMCKNVPESITYDDDYKHNLFYGFLTPLHRKGYTSIPYYNVRKLKFSRVEEYVERIFEYCENEYYSYDIFTNLFTHNKKCLGICPLTGFDSFKGLRPLLKKKKLRYKWDVEISDLWRDYMPYEFQKKVEMVTDRINNAKCWLPNSNFHKWLKTKLNNDQYEHFNKIMSSVDVHSLALYSVAYQHRCSPLHLYAYLENPDLFKNGLSIEEYNCLLFDKYGKKSYNILNEDYNNNFYAYVNTFIDSDVELDASIAEFQRPYFSGRENLSVMNSLALDFYMSSANYVSRSYYLIDKPITFNVLFNSFPCFRYYDYILNLIQDYLSDVTEKKLKVINDKFEKKSKLKNSVYA